MTPRVTVITAAYNCSRALAVTIRSVLAQTFRDFEYRVIGDGCTDASEAVVREFHDSRLHWTNLPENSGSQAAPNNEGLRQALGEFVAYIGQDDLWFPDHLEQMVAHIEETGADFVHAVGVYWTTSGPDRLEASDDLTNPHVHKSPSMWLHRREVTAAAGFWPDHRSVGQGIDDEFYWRIIRSGCRVQQCGHLTVLKFPAATFRIYASKGPLVQAAVYNSVRRDPNALRRKLLAIRYPVTSQSNGSYRLLVRAYRRIERHLGANRWPFRQLRIVVYRRRRRMALELAGLPAEMICRSTRARRQ